MELWTFHPVHSHRLQMVPEWTFLMKYTSSLYDLQFSFCTLESIQLYLFWRASSRLIHSHSYPVCVVGKMKWICSKICIVCVSLDSWCMYRTSTSFRRTNIQIMTTNSLDVSVAVAFITSVAVSQHLAKNHSPSREANCANDAGDFASSSLDLNPFLSNDDGNLVDGSDYIATCTAEGFGLFGSPFYIYANCAQENGNVVRTSSDINNVSNDNGVLAWHSC